MNDVELVIKIPEDEYNDYIQGKGTILYPSKYIHNGKLLPKFKCVYDKSSDCDHKNCDSCQYMCIAKYEIETDVRKEQ